MLLSHRDPHLALGGLVARLVRDGLDRYDPARPPRVRRGGGRGSVDGARSATKPARRDTESVARNVVRANGSDVVRQNEGGRDDTSWTADRVGTSRTSAPKRDGQAEPGNTKTTPVAAGGRCTDVAAARCAEGGHGGTTSTPAGRAAVGPIRRRSGMGKPSPAARRLRRWRPAAGAPMWRRRGARKAGTVVRRPRRQGRAAVGPIRRRSGMGRPSPAARRLRRWRPAAGAPMWRRRGARKPGTVVRRPRRRGRAAVGPIRRRSVMGKPSPAARRLRRWRTAAGAPMWRRRGARKPGTAVRRPRRRGRAAVGPIRRRSVMGKPSTTTRGLRRWRTAAGAPMWRRRGARKAGTAVRRPRLAGARKRLAYAAGHGAMGAAERSPAVERHLAALRCVGAVPGSRSRYIPAAVRREVWRRDQGCCSYVDPHSGRRCGSRYRLEIDHIVPFALGGGTEPANLRVRCRGHHRLRHAQRHAHAESVPT